MPVRFAAACLALLPALGPAAEPGPPPREAHFDANGYLLPPGAVARLGVPAPLGAFPVALAWSADGTRFVAADRSGLTVFDAASGRPVETQSFGAEIRHLYTPVGPDGRLLVFVNGPSVTVFDTAAGAAHGFLLFPPFSDPDRRITSLTVSADGRFLAGVAAPPGEAGVAWRYDLARDKFAPLLPDRADLTGVRFSPDGRRLFATGGTRRPELTARDPRAGRALWTVGLKSAATLRAVSADGRRLAATDANGLTVFDAADGHAVLAAPIDTDTPPGGWGIDLSPDGSLAALADGRGVTVWDVAAGTVRHRLAHPARVVAFSPDGRSLLSAAAWVQRWDLATGRGAYPPAVIDRPGGATALAWSGDGRRLLTGWPGDGGPDRLAVWDVGRSAPVWWETAPAPVRAVTLDGPGTTVRAADDNRLRTWHLGPTPAQDVTPLDPPPGDPFHPVPMFLPDGRLAVRTDGPGEARLDLYRADGTRDRRPARQWSPAGLRRDPSHYAAGTTVFGPDGERWDLASGRPLPPLTAGRPVVKPTGEFAAAPADFVLGRVVTAGNTRQAYLWEGWTGHPIVELPDDLRNWGVAALSPDGRHLADSDGARVGVRDLTALARVDGLSAPQATALAFSPDGRRLATALGDGSVLIWDVRQTRWASADGDAENAWRDLGRDDAGRAWRAIWHLLDHPAQATEALGGRLRPVPALADTAEVIARLDDPKFTVREGASRELAGRGAVIEGDLVEALKKATSAEQRARLEALINQLDPAVPPTGEVLRALRAVWLLERVRTPEAKGLLREVASGAAGSRVTAEAKAALRRLGP